MQLNLDIHGELIIDNFAGGGGASTGIEMALGRRVDIAINHDPEAVAMHTANHPETKHFCESVWEIDPREVTQGRPVGLVWLSPDCKHFSKAKGGKPVEKKIRGLAWVALRWAAVAQPRVIMLENVEEFRTWGPLVIDGEGKAKPCPKNKGREFNSFCNALRRQGYHVEHRELRACDYGTPTIRKRLFLIARRDGQPIVWPAATHYDPADRRFKERKGRIINPDGVVMHPWRTAAECIDFSIPCPSIFERARPLADATLRRIAKGIMRYVVEADNPFVVGSVAPVLTEHANASTPRCMPANEPLRTICAQTKGGHHALIAPTLVQTGYGERDGQAPRALDIEKPLGTLVGSQKHALVSAFLAKHYGGVVGSDLGSPISTVTSIDHHSLVTASTSGAHAEDVRAFLIKYYGVDQDPRLEDPLHTITSRDRFGLITVHGCEYNIADIGMRMLSPRELYRAQGFPESYIIDHGYFQCGVGGEYIAASEWRELTKKSQVRMCGNSVCPPLAAALVAANCSDMAITRRAA